jgi:hypothetical protein
LCPRVSSRVSLLHNHTATLRDGPSHYTIPLQQVRGLASHGGFGAFFRGLTATAAREAGWTFGFLGLAPLVKHALREDSKFFNRNDVAASLAASVLAGQAAALLTQPADTIKALLQADLARVGSPSIHSLSRVRMPMPYGLPCIGVLHRPRRPLRAQQKPSARPTCSPPAPRRLPRRSSPAGRAYRGRFALTTRGPPCSTCTNCLRCVGLPDYEARV